MPLRTTLIWLTVPVLIGISVDAPRAATPPSSAQIDTLPHPESFTRNYRFPRTAANILVMNQAIWAYNRYLREGVDNSQFRVGFGTFADNLTAGFEWDDNGLWVNHVYHPVQGSLHFAAARANTYNFWQASLWTLGGGWLWEHMGEANPPSPNDLVNSTFGGMALGESTYRLSSVVLDNRTRGSERVLREIGGALVAPARGLNRLMSGEAFRVHHNPNDRVPGAGWGELRMGHRSIEQTRGTTSQNVFGQFSVRYGDAFQRGRRSPFGFFDLELLFNVGDGDHPFGTMTVTGMLAGRVYGDDGAAQHALAAFQHMEYMDNDAYEFGGQSVSASYLGRYPLRGWLELRSTLHVTGILLGATATDYRLRPKRNYDYGSGVGYKAALAVGSRSGREYVTLARHEYFMRSVDGVDADHVIALTMIRVWVPVIRSVAAGGEYLFYDASRYYRNFAGVSAHSDEIRAYVSFVLE